MSGFTQKWSDDAEAQLADAWFIAPDRAAVTVAQHWIEKSLASDPRRHGREVSEGLWRIVAAPLAAYYEINEQQRIVRVTAVAVLKSSQ